MNVSTYLYGNQQVAVHVESSLSFIIYSVTLTLFGDSDRSVLVSRSRDYSLLPEDNSYLNKLCFREIQQNCSTETFLCPPSVPSKSQNIFVQGSEMGSTGDVSLTKASSRKKGVRRTCRPQSFCPVMIYACM